jgi:prevent-host-death family protein
VKINIHEAKTNLSKLLQRVVAGEEIIIAKGGVPLARLVPYRDETRQRQPGRFAGQGYIADDFDAPLRQFEDDFYAQGES